MRKVTSCTELLLHRPPGVYFSYEMERRKKAAEVSLDGPRDSPLTGSTSVRPEDIHPHLKQNSTEADQAADDADASPGGSRDRLGACGPAKDRGRQART